MSDKPKQYTPDALLKGKKKPDIVEVPSRLVLSIAGAGSPEHPGFGEAIGALYGVSYTLRFARKKAGKPVFKVEVARQIKLERKRSTRYARILHVGPYATEPESFAKIDEFLEAEGERRERAHLEVYLSDPNRTAPEKLKTTLLTKLL